MTKKELEDVKKYLLSHKGFNYDFGNCSRMYNMTTENIYGFLNNYDLKGKRVLTVAGSGDQRLNAYLMGASEVVCFDVNPLCELHLDLKDAAIKALTYEDFINFFGISKIKYYFDKELFKKIKPHLNDSSFNFYDFIVNNSSNIKPTDIYYEFDDRLTRMKAMNSYINSNRYYELEKIIRDKKIDFLNINIDNLDEELNGEKFDFILLSNISDYINMLYPDRCLERYKDLIYQLMGLLNLYGIMQVGYIYNRYSRNSDVSRFHINVFRNEYFPTDTFHTMFVNSYYADGTYDKVITYQKFK